MSIRLFDLKLFISFSFDNDSLLSIDSIGSIEADFNLSSLYTLINILYKFIIKLSCTKEIIMSILHEEHIEQLKNIIKYIIKYYNNNPKYDEAMIKYLSQLFSIDLTPDSTFIHYSFESHEDMDYHGEWVHNCKSDLRKENIRYNHEYFESSSFMFNYDYDDYEGLNQSNKQNALNFSFAMSDNNQDTYTIDLNITKTNTLSRDTSYKESLINNDCNSHHLNHKTSKTNKTIDDTKFSSNTYELSNANANLNLNTNNQCIKTKDRKVFKIQGLNKYKNKSDTTCYGNESRFKKKICNNYSYNNFNSIEELNNVFTPINDKYVINNLSKNSTPEMKLECLQSDPNSSLSFCMDLKSNLIQSFPLEYDTNLNNYLNYNENNQIKEIDYTIEYGSVNHSFKMDKTEYHNSSFSSFYSHDQNRELDNSKHNQKTHPYIKINQTQESIKHNYSYPKPDLNNATFIKSNYKYKDKNIQPINLDYSNIEIDTKNDYKIKKQTFSSSSTSYVNQMNQYNKISKYKRRKLNSKQSNDSFIFDNDSENHFLSTIHQSEGVNFSFTNTVDLETSHNTYLSEDENQYHRFNHNAIEETDDVNKFYELMFKNVGEDGNCLDT